VKGPLTFNATTRKKIADSNSKTPDAIIREPKAVDARTYIESNVRLVLQKNSKLQTGDKFCFTLWLLIFTVHVFL
jgi:hypothetical protein